MRFRREFWGRCSIGGYAWGDAPYLGAPRFEEGYSFSPAVPTHSKIFGWSKSRFLSRTDAGGITGNCKWSELAGRSRCDIPQKGYIDLSKLR